MDRLSRATILGIRPAAPGFCSVEIMPQLGTLTHAAGTLVHLQGEIRADFVLEDGRLRGEVELPAGISGTLIHNDQRTALASGLTRIS